MQQHLESCLNSRIEPFSLMMLALLPACHPSFKLIHGELGFKVILLANATHDTDDAGVLYADLCAAIQALHIDQQVPPITCVEALSVQASKAIWQLVESPIPPRLFSIALKLLTATRWQLQRRVSGAQTFHNTRLHVLSYLFQEPQHSMEKTLRLQQYYLHWNYSRRLSLLQKTARHDPARHDPACTDFCWPERNAYLAMSRACRDSRVLVTIHMGDFFGAFKAIADALDEPRSVISLRREGDIEAIKTLSQRHAASHQVFMHGKENPLMIVKALRAGGQTLSLLFDLGADFGETTEVMFFGQRARFVRGPAELAIMGRTRIYPFVCFSEAGRDHISMEPAFVPQVRAGETLYDAVSRVTQTLVSMAERWIRQHPAQWKYLDRLPCYLIADGAVDTNSALVTNGAFVTQSAVSEQRVAGHA
jgi:hypothetical protein